VRFGVYAGSESGIGGVYTIREDLLDGLLREVAGTPHEIVLFAEAGSRWRASDYAGHVQIVEVGHPRTRAAWALGKRAINRLFASGLQMPAPIQNESWIDPLLARHRVAFFVNLAPDALTLDVPFLCCVFDLQHRYQPFMPEVSVQGYWERWDAKFRRILGRATFVVTGTSAGRDEVVRYYQVPEERILILRHPTPQFALTAAAAPPPAPADAAPYVFYPAQFWPHKNHVTVLEAMALIEREHGGGLRLVLVGSDQGNLSFVRRRAAELGVDRIVDFRGPVPRAELIDLYRNAAALAYVSTCGPENLPPLEAFALGCPVIAGVIPGSDEQLGDAALLVDPTDARAVAGAIVTVWRDAATRRRLIEKGRARAQQFTSTGFAQGVLAALSAFEARRKCWSADEPYRRPHLWTRALS